MKSNINIPEALTVRDLLLLDAEFWVTSQEDNELWDLIKHHTTLLQLEFRDYSGGRYLELPDDGLSWLALLIREALASDEASEVQQ